MTAWPEDMTLEAQREREFAAALGCNFYFAAAPNAAYSREWMVLAYAPDEDDFQQALIAQPTWFVLNDLRANGPTYPLMVHRCDCSSLKRASKAANARDWPKVISERREALETWASKKRPTNPINYCKLCS